MPNLDHRERNHFPLMLFHKQFLFVFQKAAHGDESAKYVSEEGGGGSSCGSDGGGYEGGGGGPPLKVPVSDEVLLSLSVRDLNKQLHGLPRDQVSLK